MRGNQYYAWMVATNATGNLETSFVRFYDALKWVRLRKGRGFRRWYIKRLRDGVILAQSREG